MKTILFLALLGALPADAQRFGITNTDIEEPSLADVNCGRRSVFFPKRELRNPKIWPIGVSVTAAVNGQFRAPTCDRMATPLATNMVRGALPKAAIGCPLCFSAWSA
jgi:hypothetical protein